MNEQRANLVFEVAEACISSWLANLVGKSVDELFNGDSISKTTRPLYINKSFRRFYEIKPIIVPFDYNCDFDIISENKEAKEAVGFIMYSIKTTFMTYIQLLKKHFDDGLDVPNEANIEFSIKHLLNVGLAMDKNETFYAQYIDPDIQKREHLGICMHRLLTDKVSEDWSSNWYITSEQFNEIDNKIKKENIEEKYNKINEMIKNKNRIGISIKEIKESDIPHQYRIKSLPNISEFDNIPSYVDNENI